MGLDICVFKPIDVKGKKPKELDTLDTFILSESPELEIFSSFAFPKKNKYYDVESAIKELGFSEEDLECTSIQFGRKPIFDFYNKKHPLYQSYLYINSIWDKTYFSTFNELKESEYWTEYQKHLPVLKEHGWKGKYKFLATGNGVTYYNLVHLWNFLRKKCSLSIKNPKTITKEEICIAYEEVGYQRKGANREFYDDGKWGNPCVIDKKTLLEHWEKYFSADEERKADFKKNIVDKFVEGETFVCYC